MSSKFPKSFPNYWYDLHYQTIFTFLFTPIAQKETDKFISIFVLCFFSWKYFRQGTFFHNCAMPLTSVLCTFCSLILFGLLVYFYLKCIVQNPTLYNAQIMLFGNKMQVECKQYVPMSCILWLKRDGKYTISAWWFGLKLILQLN